MWNESPEVKAGSTEDSSIKVTKRSQREPSLAMAATDFWDSNSKIKKEEGKNRNQREK